MTTKIQDNERLHELLQTVFDAIDIDDEQQMVAKDEAGLLDLLSCFALAWGVPTRPTVLEAWKGPGLYRFDLMFDPSLKGEGWLEREAGSALKVDYVCSLEGLDKVPAEAQDIPRAATVAIF